MNKISNGRRIFLLIAGDLIAYLFSLILALTIRYSDVPSRGLLVEHLGPFSILFMVFVIVGVAVGVYNKQAAFVRGRTTTLLIQMQIVNVLIGIAFFYFAPTPISPKVNLFIYFVISTGLIYLWRELMFPVFMSGKRQPGVILGAGPEVDGMYEEINSTGRYGLIFKEKISPARTPEETARVLKEAMDRSGAVFLVADLRNPSIESAMRHLYNLIFSGTQIIDASAFYELVFDRIPLSIVGERWLVENSTMALGQNRVYDTLKRTMDVFIGLMVGLLTLALYPIIYLAIKFEDRGPIFVYQDRVGKNGRPIKIVKFRSMTSDDSGAYDEKGKTKQIVTKVGKIIRLTRLDELPQLWSVIWGEQSLIGPRPELPALVRIYEKEVPYYNARHLIKPGLSGWAQIYHQAHPHHAVAINDTKDKLSYDLYYVKNRSFMLDLKIALQTLGAIISRQGV